MSPPRVVVLAQDLIWADRLRRAVVAAGGEASATSDLERFDRALPSADAAVVDLTARVYDGLTAIERAHGSGVRVLAVGQHDDVELRKRAVALGADKVLAYRKLFEDGPATMARFLGTVVEAG